MALTIVATAGSASGNSFVTEAEAISYMAARLNPDSWITFNGSACTEDEKKALIEATRELDPLMWGGRRATDTQRLAWPRLWAPDPDSPIRSYYDSDVIPQRVKDATCELALQFVKAGTTDVAAYDSALNVVEKTVDVLHTRYAEPHQRPHGLARYPRVMKYIAPLLSGRSSSVVRVVRG